MADQTNEHRDTGQPSSPAHALMIAVSRAQRLGWRTIKLDRLISLALGDYSALPPDPAKAPRSAFGQSGWGVKCYEREQAARQNAEAGRG